MRFRRFGIRESRLWYKPGRKARGFATANFAKTRAGAGASRREPPTQRYWSRRCSRQVCVTWQVENARST
ncbi:hypothetical protein C8R44DRAFT_826756 [Mycena epipterygia]|nr:hypothetical protein C8R44DRAFT_826756 [Mycena epipterygia]